MISVYRSGMLEEIPEVRGLLSGYRGICGPVVSMVGAGGKTSMLRRLAEEYVSAGQKVIVTTTTHIMYEDKPWFLPDPDERTLQRILNDYGQVWTGMPTPGRKLKSLEPQVLERLIQSRIPVLIEADGAKRLPVKVPDRHEPVIIPETTHVFSVYGLDAVGKEIGEVCFRSELAESLLNKNRTECITAEDIAAFASSQSGGRKSCPEKSVYTVVLNKADNPGRKACALEICRILADMGIKDILVTSREKGGI